MQQSLAQVEALNPILGPTTDDEVQMQNQRDIVIIKAYTQVLCDKGICSPGLSDMGIHYRISVYQGI